MTQRARDRPPPSCPCAVWSKDAATRRSHSRRSLALHSNLVARQNGGFSYNGPNRRTEGQPTRRSTQRVAFTLPHRAQCGCSGIRLDSQRSGMEHGAGGGRARFPAIFDAAFRFAERAPRPSVPPPARLVPDRSFQKGRRTQRTATAPPLTRSLGLRRRRARPLLCLARPPQPSIATRPPTFLPSPRSDTHHCHQPLSPLKRASLRYAVCSTTVRDGCPISLSGFPSSTTASVHPSHSFEAFFAPLLRAIEYVAPRDNPSLTQ